MISLRSHLRRKLLTYFYVNRSARTYVRQLARDLDVDSTNLSRELARLEQEGFLTSEPEGRQLYYTVNPRYPYLKAVFSLLQGAIGIKPALTDALRHAKDVHAASLFGSFAKEEADATSDIDILIIGQPDAASLASEMSRLEKTLKREINYIVLTPRELKRKLADRDTFLTDIWNGKRIQLIGDKKDEATAG